MEAELKKASCNYLDGLISHREYLGQLISIFGKVWKASPEGSNVSDLPNIAERLSKE